MPKGKFIVIDGTDGAGKGTQTKLLVDRLKKMGKKVHLEDFPQYGKKSAGAVEDYLNGHYGTAEELGAYIPSVLFAIDRFSAAKRIRGYLQRGEMVISNRYVTANMAHQGGKIKGHKDRQKYFKWLFDLEFNFFKIPKPDLNIILHVPAAVAQKLVDQKGSRAYTAKKRDIHEKDLNHLKAAEKTFLEIAKQFRYPIIECFKNKQLMTREQIHATILRLVTKNL